MLHRLSLRVLPQLHLLVTDQPVRKRKRLVMLAPGLVAFGIYRLLKDVLPLSEPLVLLGLSGCVSALAAIWAGLTATCRHESRIVGKYALFFIEFADIDDIGPYGAGSNR